MTIRERIAEILVKTQFAVWIDDTDLPKTALEINTQEQRAIDYYLGKTKELMPEHKQMKFRGVVDLQRALLDGVLREYRDEIIAEKEKKL